MRILFLDQFTHWGGAQIVLRDVMIEAQQRGWEPFLMAPGDGPLADFCTSAAIPFEVLRTSFYSNGRKTIRDIVRFGFDSVTAARQVRDFVRRYGIELVYVNGPRLLPAAAASQCPMLFHAHSYLEKRYARIIADRCIGYGCANVIAVSHFAAQAFTKRTAVLYNGVEDHGYSPRPQQGGQAKIGMIGRISPEKGHLDFIRASAMLRHRDARFIVYGAALFSDPAYEHAVRSLANGAPVEFRGWTSGVAAALHEIDVLAVPSASVEACPRVVLEALSAGTPVVAYPSGGIPEIITQNETGLLTKTSTPEALAASIETLLDNPGLMERCSRQGRYDWENRFSSARFRNTIGDLIASCHPARGAAHDRQDSRDMIGRAAAQKP